MKPGTKLFFAVLGSFATALPSARAAQPADAYPNRPVRIIVPFPPGGSNDTLSRFIGAKLTDRLGQQIVIDNRSGANGIIGTEIAAEATADGYNLLFISTSYVMNAAVRELPYDVVKSFDPIAMIGSAPNSIVVNPKNRFQTLRSLVDEAKAKPGKITYASTGVGGFNHFGGELFKKITGINMLHVPYKGGSPAMLDVIAGNVQVMFSSVTQTLTHVRSGRLKLLAVGSAKRNAAVPDVPTVAESGYPGYEVSVWWGISAPAGTPRAARDRMTREITAILKDPATQKRLATEAAETWIITPAEMRKLIGSGVKKWSEVAKQAGIQIK